MQLYEPIAGKFVNQYIVSTISCSHPKKIHKGNGVSHWPSGFSSTSLTLAIYLICPHANWIIAGQQPKLCGQQQ